MDEIEKLLEAGNDPYRWFWYEAIICGIIPLINLIVFGCIVAKKKQPEARNPASWLMWFLLNGAMAASMVAAGNPRAYLPGGFALGSMIVCIILSLKGGWNWTKTEGFALIGAIGVTAIWWKTGSPEKATIALCVAMWMAAIPFLIETLCEPEPRFWWVWAIPAISSVFAIFFANSYEIRNIAFPISSLIFNSLVTWMISRKPE